MSGNNSLFVLQCLSAFTFSVHTGLLFVESLPQDAEDMNAPQVDLDNGSESAAALVH